MNKRILLSCVATTAFCAAMAACASESSVPEAYRVAPQGTDHACALGASAYAQVDLTNAGLFDQKKLDQDKTQVTLLAKKALGKDMWESVYFMKLFQNDGKSIDVVTVSTNTPQECSVEGVKTYVVSHAFGELPAQELSAGTFETK